VLTGETGAGKSLLVDALALLLGDRASSEVVRTGEDKASVEGRFDVSEQPDVARRCDEAGIETAEGWLIIRREVQREGRNRAWINGTPATAALIKDLAARLVDLHGQHEHQALLSRPVQQAMLDEFAGAAAELRAVGDAHCRLTEVVEARRALSDRVEAIRERADFLRFKLDEIDGVGLQEGEEELAQTEVRRLAHSEELLELSGGLAESLYGGDEALLDRLGEQGRRLDDLVRIDPSAEDLSELHETALRAVEELGRRMGAYHAGVEHDPSGLQRLRERLSSIDRLKRKYRGTVDEIIAEADRIREELDTIDTSDLELTRLMGEEQEAATVLEEAAARLRERRLAAATRLEEQVMALMPALGMDGGQFGVVLEPREPTGPMGSELAEFRVSLNQGFDPGPLARVGSGGELSRVMLALKTVLAAIDPVPSLVFDEIDAGIGGRVAHQVAARLAEVAGRHQVFVVTHLPQIASRAASHLRVEKSDAGGQAETRALSLAGAERVAEVARMLGGDPDSDTSRRHAEELLEAAGSGVSQT
jgi:DNA repair protein RecN (Recombination protein N)